MKGSDFNWYQWQNRFGQQRNWDIRLGVQRQKATEVVLAYSRLKHC